MISHQLESMQQVKMARTSLYLMIPLTALIFILPSQWERFQFFLLLLYPILLSYKYFKFDRQLLKKSFIFLSIFLIANLTTFLVHVWQLIWELANPNGLFGWKLYINPLLNSIPFNDGMWLRQFATPIMDRFFVYIYIHGFVFCLFGLALYYLLTGQPRKILLAMFAGHFLQYVLILPFHFWVDGHQVWWIQNQWFGYQFTDPIAGYRTITDPVIPSLNHVFPSMHTSIATVTILLAWRESSRPIKYFFTILNSGIIISTVYLGIHWVIDIFGGIIFGYLTLKLADKIMASNWKINLVHFENRVLSFVYPLRHYQINQAQSFFWWDKR
ncbi:phosphatase PAP2 family protein [Alkalihalobacterium alkalinitrilicum]|uniref:phosphatase PAP2 family protein n=1 Tax=Alkalihalobacterium alkalinitrilicum TaxID=427920 RepID=UPI000994EACF|nr:phosphatase PAP2 family protein [Alkalihalobacterium alkalinitrilicum]